MSYQVTARKWRPMTFDDIVGQSHVSNTLRNAIAQNRLAHAYLFSGPRGVGKTTTARLLAKVINCASPVDGNPCNKCEFCTEVTEGRSLDVLEIDGASNRGVEEIRNLRESVRYAPAKGKYKVYIIDEVHMLTKEAFNALLKTLEEPPPHVLFIFATTEPHKVPPTILSRCQRFDFHRNSIDEIMTRLRFIASKEQITIDDDSLLIIAKKGDGSMRDSQSIFDQVVAYCGTDVQAGDVLKALNVVDQELFFLLTDCVRTKDGKSAILFVDDLLTRGYDIKEFLVGLEEHLRNMLVVRVTGETNLLAVSEPFRKRYALEAKTFSESDLLRLIKITSKTEAEVKWSVNPRLKLEVGLLQMAKMNQSVEISSLIDRISELQKHIEGTGIKVVGTVSASMPSKAQPLSSIGKSSAAQIQKQQERSETVQSSGGQHVPIQEIKGRWEEFVSEVSRQRISLGSVLSHVEPAESGQGIVKLSCFDAYHLDSIRRNKEFLSDMTQKIYGSRLRLDAMIGSSSSAPKPALPESDHPIIEAIKRELGGELLE